MLLTTAEAVPPEVKVWVELRMDRSRDRSRALWDRAGIAPRLAPFEHRLSPKRRDAILQKFMQRLREQYQGLSFGLILLGFAVHLASEFAKGALTQFEAGIISFAFVIYVAVSGFSFWETRREKIWQEVINAQYHQEHECSAICR